jgi:hypothetical protein
MTPWLFLLLTLISAYITLETLGVLEHFKKQPKVFFMWIWGERGESVFNQSPDNLKQFVLNQTTVKIAIVCIGVTLFLANATFKAFVN